MTAVMVFGTFGVIQALDRFPACIKFMLKQIYVEFVYFQLVTKKARIPYPFAKLIVENFYIQDFLNRNNFFLNGSP